MENEHTCNLKCSVPPPSQSFVRGRAFRCNLFARPPNHAQQKGFPLQSLTQSQRPIQLRITNCELRAPSLCSPAAHRPAPRQTTRTAHPAPPAPPLRFFSFRFLSLCTFIHLQVSWKIKFKISQCEEAAHHLLIYFSKLA
jgi:hypothetical protein